METKRLIIVAVGGQGNLLASKVLGEAALLEAAVAVFHDHVVSVICLPFP